ncbi:TetR/AcrR family transcriptional regulator [Halalkalicoccus subterraneus]|uniref:TetR/AcrR family transcriptional regulator n=1 Tax=Halalkalicoccus subterraneus TaxID=2675002 RepID=UPI000EFD1A7A|nr:TetR family transcriptional regulator C-terminal domain-containing protein [Halalkalicoccus subterraneus]
MTLRRFRDDPEGTREALMAATYRALSTHGYADLTIGRIGEEFEKSVSLIYHHYDGKDDLLVDFLGYLLEEFETASVVDGDAAPDDRLRRALELARTGPLDDDIELARTLVELRAQAAHDPDYREQFDRTDRLFRDRYAAIIRSGVEQGVFRDVNPESTAEFLVTTINGAILQRVTTGRPVDPVFEGLEGYVRSHLLIGDGDRGPTSL